MPRRPAPWSSQLRPLARGARPSSGYNLSPAGGIAHVSCGGAGTTLRGSLCSPLRTWLRGGHWSSLEQFRQLAERSLRTALSVVAEDLPGVARVRAFLSCAALSFLQALSQFFDVCSAYQELKARSLGKSMFLQQERDVWD